MGWVGLDIGGANIKAADSSGRAIVVPFELWKRPEDLPLMIANVLGRFPAFRRCAVTMTAELCDCYPTKAVGVRRVLDAVTSAVPEDRVCVWGTDGRFHAVEEIHHRPEPAAAANWLALATMAARLVPEGPGLLIDIGSTTTDLVPLRDGEPRAQGRTDTERLRSGELVYAGVVRTPICALATELAWRGPAIGLAAELFASTLDVYLVLGALAPDPADHSTADGRPRTIEAARDRLARMVGADRDTFSLEDARALATAADEVLLDRLETAAARACRAAGTAPPLTAVVAGSGEFLGRRLAKRSIAPGGRTIELKEAWGPVASSAGCASALVALAEERA